MKKIHLLLLSAFVFTLFSCEEGTATAKEKTEVSATENIPLHVGKWHVTYMDMAGEEVLPSTIGNPIYTFNADKTYVIQLSGQVETGHWSLSKDVLTIKSDEVDKQSDLKLLELTKTNMKYQVGDELVTIVSLEK